MILGRSKVKGQGGKEGCALLAVDPQRRLCHSSIRASLGGANTVNPHCPQSPKFLSVQSLETLQTLMSVGGRTAPGCYHGFMLTWHRDLRREPWFERQPHPHTLSSQSLNQQCPSWITFAGGRETEGEREGQGDSGVVFLLDQTDRTPPPIHWAAGSLLVLLRGWRGAWGRGRSPGCQSWPSWPSTAGDRDTRRRISVHAGLSVPVTQQTPQEPTSFSDFLGSSRGCQ